METRANYVAVGAFVVVLLASAAGVMLWLIGSQFTEKQAYFNMSFEGSIAGLTKDSQVRYNGVPVGKVTTISIDKARPNYIDVIAAIDPDVVIRQDAIASLVSQMLSGNSYVEISGGTRTAPPFENLYAPPGQPLATKPTGGLQNILDRAPEVMEKLLGIEDQISTLLKDDRPAIDKTVANLQKLTDALANHSDDVEHILSNAADATKQIDELAKSANQLVSKAGKVVDHVDTTIGDADTAVRHADKLIGNADKLVNNVNGTVTDIRPGLREFSQRGERQLEQLIANANDFIIKLGRVVDEIDRNPGKFLFGDHNEGYKPK